MFESPALWGSGQSDDALLVSIDGVAADLEKCDKPKCGSVRHLALAIAHHALGNGEEAARSVQASYDCLRRCSGDDCKRGALFKAVLGQLLTRFANDSGSALDVRGSCEQDGDLSSAEGEAMACYLKAKILTKLRRYDDAEAEYQRSLDVGGPENTFALMGLGKALRGRRRTADRFLTPDLGEHKCFSTVFEKTGDPRAGVCLAVTKKERLLAANTQRKLEYEEYISDWREILELAAAVGNASELKPYLLVHLGGLYWCTPVSFDLKHKSEVFYRLALEKDPSNSSANHKLGQLLVRQRKVNEGVGHLRRATAEKWNGNYPAAMDLLSVEFYRQEDVGLEGEFLAIREVTRRTPGIIAVMVAHAQYRAWMMDRDGALAMLDEAAELQRKLGIPESTLYDMFPRERWRFVASDKRGGSTSRPLSGQPVSCSWRSRGAASEETPFGRGAPRGAWRSRDGGFLRRERDYVSPRKTIQDLVDDIARKREEQLA